VNGLFDLSESKVNLMTEAEKTNYQAPQTAAELLQRYQNGERYFGETELDQKELKFCNLSLAGIIFAPRSFLVADFRQANLQGADFSDCNIKTCDFRGANLENARFRNAALEATQFSEANLKNADFTGASCFSTVLTADERPDW
jgi:uncharacterized protein YjbI with pentapeptide repeats